MKDLKIVGIARKSKMFKFGTTIPTVLIGEKDLTEEDPTVPAWAKNQEKPSYTAEEVGALPSDTTIPTALRQLTEDIAHRTVTDSEKRKWNGSSSEVTYADNGLMIADDKRKLDQLEVDEPLSILEIDELLNF